MLIIYFTILVGLTIRPFLPQKQKLQITHNLPLHNLQDVNLIEARNLSISFDHPVLSSISLIVKKGETVGVLGESGTGKSVLLKIMAGFLKPDQGEILIKGQNIVSMSEQELLEIRKKLSYVFQSGAIFDFLDVGENIAYPLREQGVTDEQMIQSRVEYLLNAVELTDMGKTRFNELSIGRKKQVSIARAIANNPEVILYDEPTTGVDPIIGKSLSKLIRKLNQKENLTSVVVTHDLRCIDVVADRIILLRNGQIWFEGDHSSLNNSKDSYVQAFISKARYNLN